MFADHVLRKQESHLIQFQVCRQTKNLLLSSNHTMSSLPHWGNQAMPQWSSLLSRFMSHLFSQLKNTFGSQKKETRNGFSKLIYTSSVLCCSAMLLFPKSCHSIQLRACFIQSPARAIFPTKGRVLGVYLHIKSNQICLWRRNHSEGVG